VIGGALLPVKSMAKEGPFRVRPRHCEAAAARPLRPLQQN